MNISVLGAGSWGVALAILLEKNNHNVTLWSLLEDEVDMLNKNREHITKLPNVKIPNSIKITSDIKDASANKDIIVLATPSKFIRSTSSMIKNYVSENQIIVCVAKGFEDKTLFTLQEVINDEIKSAKVCILSGPTHAEEVSREIPTSILATSKDDEVVKIVQNTFMNSNFRVYGSNDVLGVEIGGATKNIIALAAGISDGLGNGDNSKSALMTRGMAEIVRLGVAMGAERQTFYGLSGMGDLIVTCTSMHSRNRRAGILIGQGNSLKEALDKVNMVVEGVVSAKAVLELSKKYNVDMPIIESINKILFEGKNAKDEVTKLMNRNRKYEFKR